MTVYEDLMTGEMSLEQTLEQVPVFSYQGQTHSPRAVALDMRWDAKGVSHVQLVFTLLDAEEIGFFTPAIQACGYTPEQITALVVGGRQKVDIAFIARPELLAEQMILGGEIERLWQARDEAGAPLLDLDRGYTLYKLTV